MALELLAGPFPVTYGETDEPVNFSVLQLGYHDSIGIIGSVPSVARGVICQLDGIAHQRNTAGVEQFPQPNFRTGGLCVAVFDSTWALYPTMDLRVLRGGGTDYIADTYASLGWAILPDRILRAAAGSVYNFAAGEPESSVEEFVLDGIPGDATSVARISPGPKPGQCFLSFTSGKLYLYDFVARDVVGRVRTITENVAAWYSPKWGVFIGVHEEDGQHVVRVWADETRPMSVSAPELDAEPVRGLVVTATTTVAGDDDDVCPGLNVAWSTTVGTVLDLVTTSGADGVAIARIRIDPEEAATSMDVTATVLV